MAWSRHRSAVLGALVASGALLTLGCERPASPPPPSLELPAAYLAQADGTLTIDDLRFHGRVRMDFLVYPDGQVAVSDLTAWVHDADVVARFLFWETGRERLRCTKFSNAAVAEGRTSPAGDRLTFPPAAIELTGVSFAQRDDAGACVGPARQVRATNDVDLTVRHDPAANDFGLTTALRGSYDGHDVAIGIDMAGGYLNRPPEALLGVFQVRDPGLAFPMTHLPPEWTRIQGGCPPMVAGNPPATVANDPEGLRVRLISLSTDPDGGGGRADVARDIWSHSADGATFRFLGDRQVTEPVLFATGMEHVLVLTTTDHERAAGRTICRFPVISAEEAARREGGGP